MSEAKDSREPTAFNVALKRSCCKAGISVSELQRRLAEGGNRFSYPSVWRMVHGPAWPRDKEAILALEAVLQLETGSLPRRGEPDSSVIEEDAKGRE